MGHVISQGVITRIAGSSEHQAIDAVATAQTLQLELNQGNPLHRQQDLAREPGRGGSSLNDGKGGHALD
jgi:hypothetical protein